LAFKLIGKIKCGEWKGKSKKFLLLLPFAFYFCLSRFASIRVKSTNIFINGGENFGFSRRFNLASDEEMK